MDKKIAAWALYDFGNSFITANLTLYLTQWIVVENRIEDIWISLILAFSTILLIISAPFFGIYSDRTKKRMRLITPITVLIGAATILLGLIGASNASFTIKLSFVLILYLVIQYLYQLSLIFYDTLLSTLTTPNRYGKISGLGEGIGNLGFLTGLLVTLPFISGKITLFGEPGRIQAFVPAGIGFVILSLPMLTMLKDEPSVTTSSARPNFLNTINNLKDILRNRDIFWFLLAFYFISDAILTIQTFFPIYLQQVLNLPDSTKIIFTALVVISIFAGATAIGKLGDRFGYKKTLLVNTSILAFILALIPLILDVRLIWIITPLVGILWGGFYAISRAFLTRMAPKNKLGEFFSLYTIFRRFASVVGPLIWGVSILVFSGLGKDKYRMAIYPLVFLMFFGIYLLRKVSADKSN